MPQDPRQPHPFRPDDREEQGPFDAVRSLLDAPSISDGFGTLLMHNRLDLTVEAIASRPEWRRFFTEQQLATATARHGPPPPAPA